MQRELTGDGQASVVLLRTVGLTKRFGGFTALDGVSIELAGRQIQAIIGPNGAGKSTFLNLVSGQLVPTAGRVLLGTQDITGWPPHRIAQAGVGRSFQITNVLTGRTCRENVRLAAQARRRFHNPLASITSQDREWQRAEDVLQLVGLADRADDLAAWLSHGEQRHLEIGIAMATAPRLLLLDEPTAGMSLAERGRMTELIRRLGRETTILLIEHDVELVRRVAERAVALHQGRVLCQGPPAEVLADPAVHDVYLRGLTVARRS